MEYKMNTRIRFSEIPKELIATLIATEEVINKMGFDYKLLELIRLRVSSINQCAYCIDMHFKEAMAAGEMIQRLYSVSQWQETCYYSAEEKACLAWAEYITVPYKKHNEQVLFDQLLVFFDKEKIANLTLVIIHINSWNRLMKSFAIEAGGYQVGQHELIKNKC